MLNIIVGKNPRNTGNLPCLTSLCIAKSQTAGQNSDPNLKQSLSGRQIPPQNTFTTVKGGYLWNLRLIPDKTPARTPSSGGTTSSQGLGCVPGAQAGVCPPRQYLLRGSCAWHTPVSSCTSTGTGLAIQNPVLVIILLLHHLCGSQAAPRPQAGYPQRKRALSISLPNIPAQMGLKRVPGPGQGCDTTNSSSCTNPSQKLPPLPPSRDAAPLAHWINAASKEQILEHPSNSEINESSTFPVSLQFLPLKRVMLPFCLAQTQIAAVGGELPAIPGPSLSPRCGSEAKKQNSCEPPEPEHIWLHPVHSRE